MPENIVTFIIAFMATNIDDIFILTLFYGSRRYSHLQLVTGQLLGILVLVGISAVISLVGNFIDPRYVGLMGLFPIYLGIKQMIALFKHHHDAEEPEEIQLSSKYVGFISIALVTMANGGDNIGIYVPLLATLTVLEKMQLVATFTVMVFIWCYIARYLAHHPLLKKSLDKYAHLIMPVVLIALGIFILMESNVWTVIYQHVPLSVFFTDKPVPLSVFFTDKKL